MEKIVITINGMKCLMCEAHVNDLFRKSISAKKIRSNHRTGQTIIITKDNISDEMLENALNNSGYIISNIVRTKPKKVLFFYR